MTDQQITSAVARPSPGAILSTFGVGAVVVNTLGLAALLMLLSRWPDWIAVTLAACSLAGVALLQRRGILEAYRSPRLAGTYLAARLLVLCMVAIQLSSDQGDTPSRVAVPILGLLVIGEPVLRRLAGLARPYAARIPGFKTRYRPYFGVGLVFVLNGLGLVSLLVTAFTPVSGWIGLAWAILCLLVSLVALWDAFERVRDRRRFERRIAILMARKLRPVFAIHWEAPRGTAYQIGMWLPYLERLGRPYFILVRTEANFNEVLALGDEVATAPVILRKNIPDLDAVIAPSLKVMFYVNTATKNAHTIRYSELTHIQLNHGDSDKAPSYNPVFRMYDKNFVAGQAAIDRFADHGVDMPPGIFSIVGRPQVEGVQVADRPIAAIAPKTVLYAPTWGGFYADSNYSSLAVGVEIVEALVRLGCAVIFRPHPYARRSPVLRTACDRIIDLLAADAKATGAGHLYGPEAESGLSVFDCFNRSDAMVSDVSSVVGDYLYSEKPFAMVAVTAPAQDFGAEFPVSRAGYVIDAHDGRINGLDATLEAMLGPDPMAQTRRQLKTYYLGDIPADHYADRFLEEARKFL